MISPPPVLYTAPTPKKKITQKKDKDKKEKNKKDKKKGEKEGESTETNETLRKTQKISKKELWNIYDSEKGAVVLF